MYLTRCGMEPPYEEVQGPAKLFTAGPSSAFHFLFLVSFPLSFTPSPALPPLLL